jgi:hypothetical protein
MKNNKFKLLTLFLLVALFTNLSAATGTGEYVKEINRSFPLSLDGQLELANKYGRINIRTWDKEEVKIDVRIVVQARDEDEADEVFERISINFYDADDLVKAYTEIGTNNGKSGWGDWITNGGSSSREFKIYYEVVMPYQADLNTEARYCDVRATDLSGDTQWNIKYGNLITGHLNNAADITIGNGSGEIAKISGEAKLNISYSELEVKSASTVNLRARYSEIEIESAGDVEVDCRYSEVKLGKSRVVNVDAGYGDVDIESATSVKANSNYTSYEIGRVTTEVDIDTDYGNVELGPLAAGFRLVRIRGGYSSIDVSIESAAGYSIDLSSTYAGIDYPSSLNLTSKEKDGNTNKVIGTKSGKGEGRIEITTKYGGVDIREY